MTTSAIGEFPGPSLSKFQDLQIISPDFDTLVLERLQTLRTPSPDANSGGTAGSLFAGPWDLAS